MILAGWARARGAPRRRQSPLDELFPTQRLERRPDLGVMAIAMTDLCESAPKRDPASDGPQLLDTLKEILFRVGVPIGADRDPTFGVLSGDFSDLLLI